jgi:L-glyceraldehyde 3-phosphate reductase
VAEARGEDMATTALKWILSDRRVTSLIVGISSVAQLDADLKALAAPDLSAEELAALG